MTRMIDTGRLTILDERCKLGMTSLSTWPLTRTPISSVSELDVLDMLASISVYCRKKLVMAVESE
jgi:hypothetical protein